MGREKAQGLRPQSVGFGMLQAVERGPGVVETAKAGGPPWLGAVPGRCGFSVRSVLALDDVLAATSDQYVVQRRSFRLKAVPGRIHRFPENHYFALVPTR